MQPAPVHQYSSPGDHSSAECSSPRRTRPPAARRLCELNVKKQVFAVCTSGVVQEAWEHGRALSVYGVIYDVKDGVVRRLVGPICG